jgi:phosphotransferase system HPr (HPr) family protein
MVTRTVLITLPEGLHARPAARLAELAGGEGTLQVVAPGRDPVDCACVLSVLALGVRSGETVELRAAGDDADALLDEAERLLVSESRPAA